MLWDIFCRVIDNFGDIGVCWRLGADLATRGHSVRLWIDDPAALAWMAPGALEGRHAGITVYRWADPFDTGVLPRLAASDVWIEGFGCELPALFIHHFANQPNAQTEVRRPVWINFEYLSAESYVERAHGLPSPVMSGPAAGWTKHFFYPGFTERTGGLLREPGIPPGPAEWNERTKALWLEKMEVPRAHERLISLFCYEPPYLQDWLAQLAGGATPTLLLVTAGRASALVQSLNLPSSSGALKLHYLPPMPQTEYDRLLWTCDINFVRGEDSVIRALWAGKPFVWNIYPQDDGAHQAKLDAFLDATELPPPIRHLHYLWNHLPAGQDPPGTVTDALSDLPGWQQSVQKARNRLMNQKDLTTQLVRFVQKKR